MPKLLKEPLFQFLLGGFFLYVAISVSQPFVVDDSVRRPIVLDDAVLTAHIKFLQPHFTSEGAAKFLSEQTAELRADLEKGYLQNEVLFREAQSLGLGEGDDVVRRRMIQIMDFVVEGMAEQAGALTDEELVAFFDANSGNYHIDAEASFSHIFFRSFSHGASGAFKKAETLLPQLHSLAVTAAQSAEYGDVFLFEQQYVKQPKRLLLEHFGADVVEGILSREAGQIWFGPLRSRYGSHLILLAEKLGPREPRFQEVSGQVAIDAKIARFESARAAALKKMADKYVIQKASALQSEATD